MNIEPNRIYQPADLVTGLVQAKELPVASAVRAVPVHADFAAISPFDDGCHDVFTLTDRGTDVKQQPRQQPEEPMDLGTPMFSMVFWSGGQGRNRTADTKQAYFRHRLAQKSPVSARFAHIRRVMRKSNSNQMATGIRVLEVSWS
jgi:hypothetical protein